MIGNLEGRLQAGILAAQRGSLEESQLMLASVVNEDPANETGWYWLGLMLTSQAEKTWCFQQVLSINPDNPDARRQLEVLTFDAVRSSGMTAEDQSGLDIGGMLSEKPKVLRSMAGDAPGDSLKENPSAQGSAEGPVVSELSYTKPFIDKEDDNPPEFNKEPLQPDIPGPFNTAIEEPGPMIKPLPDRDSNEGITDPLQNRLNDQSLQELRITATEPDPSDNPSAVSKNNKAKKPILLWAGLVLLILVAAGAGFVWLNGQKPRAAAAAPTSASTQVQLPAGVTPAAATIQPTAALAQPPATQKPPTSTPAPTATQTLKRRLESAQGNILIAQDHLKARRYDLALQGWNKLIAGIPDSASLYLWRAETVFAQAEAESVELEEYQSALQNALDDLKQAELLEPGLNGLASARARIEMAMARNTPDKTERSQWFEQAGLHADEAGAVAGADEEVILIPYYLRMAKGECREVLTDLQSANPLGASADTISTGWHTALAAASMCAGSNSGALKEIELALVQPTTDRLTLKAMIYYNLGMYDLVIQTVDSWIAMIPQARSDRYFLRALAYLEQGKRDLARQDLLAGQAESWDPDGLGLFIQGRLTAASGDTKNAEILYRQAEDRMRLDYRPLVRRVHNYLLTLING